MLEICRLNFQQDNAVQQSPHRGELLWGDTPHCPEQLGAGKVTGHGFAGLRGQPCLKRQSFGFIDEQLDQGRSIEIVGHFQYRSSARISASASESFGPVIGVGMSARLCRAGRARPEVTNSSRREAGIAVRRATGCPRNVMVMTSPAAALATTAEAFCFNALIPISVMCYIVALRSHTVRDTMMWLFRGGELEKFAMV